MDEAWRQFEISGKITDYLKCKQIYAGEIKKDVASKNERINEETLRMPVEERNSNRC